jgi:hypothetical protein
LIFRLQVERPVKDFDPCEIEPDHLTPFGIFSGRNGSGLDIRSVNTGAERIEDKGLVRILIFRLLARRAVRVAIFSTIFQLFILPFITTVWSY